MDHDSLTFPIISLQKKFLTQLLMQNKEKITILPPFKDGRLRLRKAKDKGEILSR